MSAFPAWSYYGAVEQAPASTPSNKVQTNRPCHCCLSRHHCSHTTGVFFFFSKITVKYIEYFRLSATKQKLLRPQTSCHLRCYANSVASVPGWSISTASSEGHKTNTAVTLCAILYLSEVTITGRKTIYLHFQLVTSSEWSTGSLPPSWHQCCCWTELIRKSRAFMCSMFHGGNGFLSVDKLKSRRIYGSPLSVSCFSS